MICLKSLIELIRTLNCVIANGIGVRAVETGADALWLKISDETPTACLLQLRDECPRVHIVNKFKTGSVWVKIEVGCHDAGN
jgi:hypothetical protein